MEWNNVFSEINSISVDEVKAYIEDKTSSAYQIVDVRQPQEFMKKHLPGAISAPLDQLINGDTDLALDLPTLVYCAKGERSLSAVRWMVDNGFSDVHHIVDGIEGWSGNLAFGHEELNLNLIQPGTSFPDAISMAYAMEEGLRQFYIELGRETSDEIFRKLYRKLASFEVEHKTKLKKKYETELATEFDHRSVEEEYGPILEGGGYADITLIKTLANADDAMDIFSLALAFEVQAFDFYYRLSRKAERTEVKDFFLEMADEEKIHLRFISNEMDKYLNTSREK